jgi:mono/diheme cytochrome c family protein
MKKWVGMAFLLFVSATSASPGTVLAASPSNSRTDLGIERTTGPATGRSDYRANCAKCHGANALLTMKTARQLHMDPRKLSLMASEMNREEMIGITEKGKGKMPGFEKELAKERIAAIVDYVLDFRAKRTRKDSLIRQKAPLSPPPAPAETSGKNPETAP